MKTVCLASGHAPSRLNYPKPRPYAINYIEDKSKLCIESFVTLKKPNEIDIVATHV